MIVLFRDKCPDFGNPEAEEGLRRHSPEGGSELSFAQAATMGRVAQMRALDWRHQALSPLGIAQPLPRVAHFYGRRVLRRPRGVRTSRPLQAQLASLAFANAGSLKRAGPSQGCLSQFRF